MTMKTMMALVGAVVLWQLPYLATAEEAGASIDEVQEKVKAAAEAIATASDKKAILAEFDGKNEKWAWKDTYVFVYDCKADQALAHPTLTGKPILGIKDKADGLVFGGDTGLCKAGEQKEGGWSAYMWPKVPEGEAASKATFAMSVAGTDYQVAAGIYADKKVENFKLAD